MINRKNFLGRTPEELALKDAVHVAIVSVRAACFISPGTKCTINEFGEAVAGNGPGIANPWHKGDINRGDYFWLLLNPTELETVQHTWSHNKFEFNKPTREPQLNSILEEYANEFGVSYQQLMDAIRKVVDSGRSVIHPGGKTEEELDMLNDDIYDLWYEWAEEVNYEFDNMGTMCCPEYDYPRIPLFVKGDE